MPHEACFDSFEAEMLEPCGLSAIWVLSTFSHSFKRPPAVAYKRYHTKIMNSQWSFLKASSVKIRMITCRLSISSWRHLLPSFEIAHQTFHAAKAGLRRDIINRRIRF